MILGLIMVLRLILMPNISIIIPTYEMHSEGTSLLHILLNSIYKQTYKDFEVIVSDHSKNKDIENFCKNYGKVIYLRNNHGRGLSSTNLNYAIKHSRGQFIKPLFQDDFFKTESTLQLMMNKMSIGNWCACGSDQYDKDMHKPYRARSPVLNADLGQLALGENYIGGPSCILYKKCNEIFDENLFWLVDCEFYRRLYLLYGAPQFIPDILITTKYNETNVSNTLATKEVRQKEYDYVYKKIYG